MFKLRTLDVWDTLLRRDCHPECIKRATCNYLLLKHHTDLKEDFRSLDRLYEMRLTCESNLAHQAQLEGYDEEYQIRDVFERLLDRVTIIGATEKMVLELEFFELQVELRRSSPDPQIEAFLASEKSEKTLFLSDFYMGSDALKKLLKEKGMEHLAPDGYSSCDIKLNKRSGRIFRHLHTQLGIDPEDHVHIGDNPWSDVEAPSSLGIQTRHYIPDRLHHQRLDREALFLAGEDLTLHFQKLLLDSPHASLGKLSGTARSGYQLGRTLAPLFIGFSVWIAEQSLQRKVSRLAFCTREGEFFYRLHHALFPEGHHNGSSLPPAIILEVSRLSTFTASLSAPYFVDMKRVWNLFGQQSVAGLFKTLSIRIDLFSDSLKRLKLTPDENIETPQTDLRLKQLFELPEFQRAIEDVVNNQKVLLSQYLDQKGIQADQTIGLVDIGWRGTIQDNLCRVAPSNDWDGMYLGLRELINEQPQNSKKTAYGPNENLDRTTLPYFENFAVMEMLCNSDSGSVCAYTRSGSQVLAERLPWKEEEAAFEQFSRSFQEAVIDSCAYWSPLIDRHVITAENFRPVGMHLWKKLIDRPTTDLVNVFMSSSQDDTFGFGTIFSRSAVPSVMTIILSPFSKVQRRNLIDYVRRVQWTSAIAQTQKIGILHRLLLTSVFQLANSLKRARNRRKLTNRR